MTSVDYTVPATGSAPPLPDQLSPVGRRSDLDDVLADLTAAIEEETITEQVPLRKGFSVTYKTHIDAEELRLWQGKARNGDDFSATLFFQLVLAAKCKSINKPDGSPLRDENGTPLVFKSPEFQEAYHTEGDALATVSAFYAYEPDLLNTGIKVTNASRWGDSLQNPTNG